MNSFRDFSLESSLLQALDTIGYQQPTEIQAKTLPILLKNQTIDFHGQAQTGTGKTLAFGLPLLHHIDLSNKHTQALIVAPTRELAVQIQQQLQSITQFKKVSIIALYGGMDINEQRRKLSQGAQIVIGTPGRLLDHLNRKTISLKDLKTIVLDEADIMLDMGFRDDIELILSYTPKSRSIWLFSATIKDGIAQMMRHHMHNTVSVSVSKQQVTNVTTEQFYSVIPSAKRFSALCRFVETTADFYGFIFCPTKAITSELADRLKLAGYRAQALHGDMQQTKRNKVITAFKKQEFSILVATDVAARGIDVQNISHVINYGFPDDPENYIHRIGRTGRAGKSGTAITLLDQRHLYALQRLAKRYHFNITEFQMPSMDVIIKQKLITVGHELQKKLAQATVIKFQEQLEAVIQSFTSQEQQILLSKLIYEKWLHSVMHEPESSESQTGQRRNQHFKKRRQRRRY